MLLVYLVQSGDTCSEIAEAYGVAISDIVSKNDGMSSDCGVLFTGQTLFIPQPYGPIDTPVSIRSPTLPAPKTTQRSDQDGMRLVFIPGGEFLMGRGETGSETSGFAHPAHEIFLNDFWIDITEVTNKMYARCLQSGACQAPGERSSRTRSVYFDEPDYEDYPVIFVNWDDAQDYCRWAGRRLPSEAEWEKAARGIDDREFPWGNGLPTMRLANFGNLLGDTNRVGSYPNGVSPFGVLDLAGNVAEWVSDWYGADYYAASPYKNPKGPESGDFKILRGGSWFTQAQTLQVTFRLWNYPELRSDTVGFRCAK